MTLIRDAGPETVNSSRLPVIDSIRALALFGVIVMNMVGMVMALTAEQVISRAGPPDFIFATFDLVFLQGKARSMFAFLFGVGFGLLMSRTGPGFVGFYLRRMSVLLAIGLFNLTFLFWGDILILYALLGMLMLLFRGWSDRAVLTLGLILVIAPPLAIGLVEGVVGAQLAGINGQTAAQGWAAFEAHAGTYSEGTLLQIAQLNLDYYVRHQLFETPYVVMYDLGVLGLFLLGLWTARRDVFADLERHRPLLRRIVWICLPAGLTVSAAYAAPLIMQLELTGWIAGAARAAYLGLPVAALGYAALLALWLPRGGRWLQRALTPMGRMALTGYLTANLVGSFVWYGWGLGLLGQLNFTAMNMIAWATFAGLCLFSWLWLRRFPNGPVEGLWRRLSGPRSRPAAHAPES